MASIDEFLSSDDTVRHAAVETDDCFYPPFEFPRFPAHQEGVQLTTADGVKLSATVYTLKLNAGPTSDAGENAYLDKYRDILRTDDLNLWHDEDKGYVKVVKVSDGQFKFVDKDKKIVDAPTPVTAFGDLPEVVRTHNEVHQNAAAFTGKDVPALMGQAFDLRSTLLNDGFGAPETRGGMIGLFGRVFTKPGALADRSGKISAHHLQRGDPAKDVLVLYTKDKIIALNVDKSDGSIKNDVIGVYEKGVDSEFDQIRGILKDRKTKNVTTLIPATDINADKISDSIFFKLMGTGLVDRNAVEMFTQDKIDLPQHGKCVEGNITVDGKPLFQGKLREKRDKYALTGPEGMNEFYHTLGKESKQVEASQSGRDAFGALQDEAWWAGGELAKGGLFEMAARGVDALAKRMNKGKEGGFVGFLGSAAKWVIRAMGAVHIGGNVLEKVNEKFEGVNIDVKENGFSILGNFVNALSNVGDNMLTLVAGDESRRQGVEQAFKGPVTT